MVHYFNLRFSLTFILNYVLCKLQIIQIMFNHFHPPLLWSFATSSTFQKVNYFTSSHWHIHIPLHVTESSAPILSYLIFYGRHSYFGSNHFIHNPIKSYVATHSSNHSYPYYYQPLGLNLFNWLIL